MPLDDGDAQRRGSATVPAPGAKYLCVTSFDEVRDAWGIACPSRGEVVTLAYAEPHQAPTCAALGIVLLHFVEYPEHPTGMCDKKVDGTVNFEPIAV